MTQRYQILDGFRGFFLVFMMVAHINQIVPVTLGRLNHHSLGWVEDAQGFVFLSGVVVGLVYGRLLLCVSFAAMQRGVFRRIRTIYSHHVGLMLMLLALALILRGQGSVPDLLTSFAEAPVDFTVTSLLLISASPYMDILPMYLWFMLLTPVVLHWFRQGHALSLVAVSVAAWVFAQTGLLEIWTEALEVWLGGVGIDARLGITFQLFGWQVIYFSGLYIGFLMAGNRLDLSVLKQARVAPVFWIAVCVALLLALYDRLVWWNWISIEYSQSIAARFTRETFSPLHMLNFYVDLLIFTWLVVVGPSQTRPLVRGAAAVVIWVFTWRPLVFLGQHSLHVFSAHVAVIYAFAILSEHVPLGELVTSVLILVSVASLFLAAWVHVQLQARASARAAARG